MHWSKGADFYGSTCCSCPPWCHLVINNVISGIESIQGSCALGHVWYVIPPSVRVRGKLTLKVGVFLVLNTAIAKNIMQYNSQIGKYKN